MKRLKFYYINSFTTKPFQGNPAGVVILDDCLEDRIMQSIAKELALSETAFVLPLTSDSLTYTIRWFSPLTEVSLCGHATLAAVKALSDLNCIDNNKLTFLTKNNEHCISAFINKGKITLTFNSDNIVEVTDSVKRTFLEAFELCLDSKVFRGLNTNQYFIAVKDSSAIYNLNPCMTKLTKSICFNSGVSVTALSHSKYDYISRFFDPWEGINEDPVTGSAQTLLAPYWSKQLNKKYLIAKQESERGGEINIMVKDDLIEITGFANIFIKGVLETE